jgi:hypothetical protein
MADGLRLKDANGVVFFDTADSTVRIFGITSIGSSNGSVTDSRYAEVTAGQARFFAILQCNDNSGHVWEQPTISLSGNTVSWTWPAGATNFPNFTLTYGAY